MENQEQQDNLVTYWTVKYTVGWLPSTIGLTEQSKAVLAKEQGVDAKVLRGSYAILGASNDTLIKEGAALRRTLGIIRDKYTIPEYTLVGTSNDSENLKPEKVGGSYLIETSKLGEFLEEFNAAKSQYLLWGKRVAEEENYQKLRDSDRAKLGKDWAIIERKYPSAAEIADAITCDEPRIEPYNAKFSINNLAPAVAQSLKQQAEQRFQASIDGAVGELVFELKEMVATVARNCGRRIRLLPALDSEHVSLREAEVKEIVRSTDSDEIPEGYLQLVVQESAPAEKGGFKQIGKEKTLLLTEAEYLSLKPYETNEFKSVTQSGFENLMDLAKKITTVKSMLGEENKSVIDLAKEVQDTLANMGNSAASITKTIKDNGYARQTAQKSFNALLGKIAAQEIEVRNIAKAKRKIDKACVS